MRETFVSVVCSAWRQGSAAAAFYLVTTVCRSAVRDVEGGTWVRHSSAYPTETEKRAAIPALFTRSVRHSYSLWEAVLVLMKMSEL